METSATHFTPANVAGFRTTGTGIVHLIDNDGNKLDTVSIDRAIEILDAQDAEDFPLDY